jgi:hypothetical protein
VLEYLVLPRSKIEYAFKLLHVRFPPGPRAVDHGLAEPSLALKGSPTVSPSLGPQSSPFSNMTGLNLSDHQFGFGFGFGFGSHAPSAFQRRLALEGKSSSISSKKNHQAGNFVDRLVQKPFFKNPEGVNLMLKHHAIWQYCSLLQPSGGNLWLFLYELIFDWNYWSRL